MYYFKKFQKREIGVINRKQPQTSAKNRKGRAKNQKKTSKNHTPQAPTFQNFFLKGKLKIILDKSIFSEYTSDIKRKRSLL